MFQIMVMMSWQTMAYSSKIFSLEFSMLLLSRTIRLITKDLVCWFYNGMASCSDSRCVGNSKEYCLSSRYCDSLSSRSESLARRLHEEKVMTKRPLTKLIHVGQYRSEERRGGKEWSSM